MQEDIEKKNDHTFAECKIKDNSILYRRTESSDDDEDEDEIEDKLSIHEEQLNRQKNEVQIKTFIQNHQNPLTEEIIENHKGILNLRKTDANDKKKKIKKLVIRKETKRWTLEENRLYMNFLEGHAHLFRYKTVRRIRQVFIMLSEKMGGKRTPSQCKSHHQKMKNATEKGTMKEIIAYIKSKNFIFPPTIQRRFQKHCCEEGIKISSGWNLNNYEIKIKLERGSFEKW